MAFHQLMSDSAIQESQEKRTRRERNRAILELGKDKVEQIKKRLREELVESIEFEKKGEETHPPECICCCLSLLRTYHAFQLTLWSHRRSAGQRRFGPRHSLYDYSLSTVRTNSTYPASGGHVFCESCIDRQFDINTEVLGAAAGDGANEGTEHLSRSVVRTVPVLALISNTDPATHAVNPLLASALIF